MMTSILEYLAPIVILFLLLWVSIPIGILVARISQVLCLIIMLALGSTILYFTYSIFHDLIDCNILWNWYDLVGVLILIGAMNGTKSSEAAYNASTYLFTGVIVMAVIMFWINN